MWCDKNFLGESSVSLYVETTEAEGCDFHLIVVVFDCVPKIVYIAVVKNFGYLCFP